MRRMALILAAVVAIGSVNVASAGEKKAPRYPCAFQRKVDNRWTGKLSLRKANALRKQSVQLGQRVAVRLNDVTTADVPFMIECVAKAYDMDPAPFLSVADCESHGDPEAYNPAGPYTGIFQYLESTWLSSSATYDHAGAPVTDGYAQIHVTVQKVKAEGWGAWGICI